MLEIQLQSNMQLFAGFKKKKKLQKCDPENLNYDTNSKQSK